MNKRFECLDIIDEKDGNYIVECYLCGRKLNYPKEFFEVELFNPRYSPVTHKTYLRGYRSNATCTCHKPTSGYWKTLKAIIDSGFDYQVRYAFDDLYDKNNTEKLIFDFALFNNNQLVALVLNLEENHFKNKDFDHKYTRILSEEQFEEQLANDYLKRKYCDDNGIMLVEVDQRESRSKNTVTTLTEQFRELYMNSLQSKGARVNNGSIDERIHYCTINQIKYYDQETWYRLKNLKTGKIGGWTNREFSIDQQNQRDGFLSFWAEGETFIRAKEVDYIPDGAYYGDWKSSQIYGKRLRDGDGIITYKDGTYYDGQWKDDKRNGHGTEIKTNGWRYEGNWNDNMREGQGTEFMDNGQRYEGSWRNNKYEGHGIFVYPDGSYFESEWKEGKLVGNGVLKNPDGQVCDGEWNNGQFTGKMFVYNHGGSLYDGEWRDGKRDGRGILSRPVDDNLRYEGEWKNGKKEGYGIFIILDPDWKSSIEREAFARADDYKEEWIRRSEGDDEYHFEREYYDSKDDYIIRYYEGYWKEDKADGKGKAIINGCSSVDNSYSKLYDGEWKDGKKQGKGVCYYNDKPVRGYRIKQLQGLEAGCSVDYTWKYEGEWKNGKRDGQGKILYNNGNEYEGEWKDGEYDGRGKFIKYIREYEKELHEDFQGQEHWTNVCVKVNVIMADGEWKKNKPEGYGIAIKVDEKQLVRVRGDWNSINENFIYKYEGEWKNGKRDGQGKILYNNGNEYEGEWKDGEYDGKGKLSKYEYNHNMLDEFGDIIQVVDKVYTEYEGEYKKGKEEGKGIKIWVNIDDVPSDKKKEDSIIEYYYKKYEGEWKDGTMNGHGVMTFSDGKIVEGKWENGHLRRSAK